MQYPLLFQKNAKLILILTAVIVFILAFWGILTRLATQWAGAEWAAYNHGFLVLLCTIYLLFKKRSEFENLTPAPQRVGFVPLVFLSILLFLAELAEIQSLQILIILLIILASIFIVLGKEFLKLAFVPMGILLFAIPVWTPILPVLQDITTWITEVNLKILGRPVFVDGNYIHVAGGVFLIEEACSGLRFLLIASILSMVNSELNSYTVKQGAVLFLVAVALAFLANWLRVIIIVVLGDMTNMQHSLVQDHLNFGWVVFLFVVLIPFLLISRLVPEHAILVQKSGLHDAKKSYCPQYFLMTLLVIISVPFLRYGHELILKRDIADIEAPLAVGNWNSNNNSLSNGAWKPGYKNATRELFRSYQGVSGTEIDLNIFHYDEQRQGAELINEENSITNNVVWSEMPSGEYKYFITNNKSIKSVNAIEIMNISNNRKLVWYWYDVGGYITSNKYYAKAFQIFSQLQGKNYGDLIAISVLCEEECKEKEQYLEDYVSGWREVDK